MAAAWHGDEVGIRQLLRQGADATRVDLNGASAIALAGRRGFGAAAAALRASVREDVVYDIYAYDAHAASFENEEEEDDDALSTRCVASSPNNAGRGRGARRQAEPAAGPLVSLAGSPASPAGGGVGCAPNFAFGAPPPNLRAKTQKVYGIHIPLSDVLALPQGDGDSVSSLDRADDESIRSDSVESNDEDFYANDYPDGDEDDGDDGDHGGTSAARGGAVARDESDFEDSDDDVAAANTRFQSLATVPMDDGAVPLRLPRPPVVDDAFTPRAIRAPLGFGSAASDALKRHTRLLSPPPRLPTPWQAGQEARRSDYDAEI
mmetsp:Transcript_7406/g.25924  ORF Transcript_7406/g.25924 Transcript_7406/m.25924 type:complete len:320 (+) Transcript_7406:128-1087(+)